MRAENSHNSPDLSIQKCSGEEASFYEVPAAAEPAAAESSGAEWIPFSDLTPAVRLMVLTPLATVVWPLERLVALCLAIEAGATRIALAAKFGVTKNAISGKSHRLVVAGVLRSGVNPAVWAPDDPRRSNVPTGRGIPPVDGPTLPPLPSDAAALRVSGPIPSPEGVSPAWPADAIATLRRLRDEHKTDPEIGEFFGKSKNAIRNKARRLGLPVNPLPGSAGRPRSATPAPKRLTPAALNRPLRTVPKPRPVGASPDVREIPRVPRYTPPVERHGRVVECSWPIGEPGTRDFRFCDQPSERGCSYCEEHNRIGHIRARGHAAPSAGTGAVLAGSAPP